jgi:hypothetical protein
MSRNKYMWAKGFIKEYNSGRTSAIVVAVKL